MRDIRSTFGLTRAVLRPSFREDVTDSVAIDPAIKCILGEIVARLADAARIAKTADICDDSGSVTEGITISMEIDQMLYEVGRLHDAASLLSRLSRE